MASSVSKLSVSKLSVKECIICTEKITPSKVATCPYCEHTSCISCVRRYVLNETETQCMNCKKPWTRAHQNAILKPSFVNSELKKHQEQVLFEREMAQFPATIEVIEERRVEIKLRAELNISQEKVNAARAHMYYLRMIIHENEKMVAASKLAPKLYSAINLADLEKNTAETKIQKAKAMEEYNQDLYKELVIRNLLGMTGPERKVVVENFIEGADPAEILETLRQTGQLGEALKRSNSNFVRACPIESCKGFLNQRWRCGMCETVTCSKCNVPKIKNPESAHSNNNNNKEEEHVCNPDDVATAELLAKDTKPCPQCGTGIYKIDGCDQMWCTECRCAFSWKTGQMETGHVHNPHFFEYQRRIGAEARNIFDVPCGALAPQEYHGVINYWIQLATNSESTREDARTQRGLPPMTKETKHMLRRRAADYAVSLIGFAEQILPRYRPDAVQNNLELRVQYLTEQIGETAFRSALSREAKQFNQKREIGQVIQTVVVGMSDILNRLINFMRKHGNHPVNADVCYCDQNAIIGFFGEIDTLIDYANECLEFICKQYKLTRVAMFVRENTRPSGLFTVRVAHQNTQERQEGGEVVQKLIQVKWM